MPSNALRCAMSNGTDRYFGIVGIVFHVRGFFFFFATPEKHRRQMALNRILLRIIYIFSNISTRERTHNAIKIREADTERERTSIKHV